ncbi:hypothetical protein AB6D20_027415 (plasmid) [Vibrio splendidus]
MANRALNKLANRALNKPVKMRCKDALMLTKSNYTFDADKIQLHLHQ